MGKKFIMNKTMENILFNVENNQAHGDTEPSHSRKESVYDVLLPPNSLK
jgi:hypothetical protein